MDAMKYSIAEADKYRAAAYIPPSTLAMSMYSDQKYLDSSPKYLERTYFDSAKAYFEHSSKLYMNQKTIGDYNRTNYDNKLYEDTSPGSGSTARSPPISESPDVIKQHNNITNDRTNEQHNSSNASTTSTTPTSSTSAASPGSNITTYYSSTGQTTGLLTPQISQYGSYQTNQTPGDGFRRPVTVIY